MLTLNESTRKSNFVMTGRIIESKGMRAIFKEKGKKFLKKGKIFENLGKNIQNLKKFRKRTGDCV